MLKRSSHNYFFVLFMTFRFHRNVLSLFVFLHILFQFSINVFFKYLCSIENIDRFLIIFFQKSKHLNLFNSTIAYERQEKKKLNKGNYWDEKFSNKIIKGCIKLSIFNRSLKNIDDDRWWYHHYYCRCPVGKKFLQTITLLKFI